MMQKIWGPLVWPYKGYAKSSNLYIDCISILYFYCFAELLTQIFECLYQSDVISEEGFEAWSICNDPAEQEGKGVASKSTTQFFTWMREIEDDVDDEPEATKNEEKIQ
jgi:hypothetical protein